MSSIRRGELPPSSLLDSYRQQGVYTDCYVIELPGPVSQSGYVEAFYTTALFKVERSILALLASRPATDSQARQLAYGEIDEFSAWSVENRTDNQLLLCDMLGHTRSWLMSEPGNDSPATTRLYFGSAIIPKQAKLSGEASYGFAFHALSGFHHLYSQALLRSACVRLQKLHR